MTDTVNFPWRGQQQCRTIFAFGCLFANAGDGFMQVTHESRFHHQVFRRIARQHQFGIQNNISAPIGRRFPGSHNLVPVTGNIADNRVKLGNRNGKHICHDVGIGAALRGVNCGIRNIPCFKRDCHSCMAELQHRKSR